ncbi:hypothetical protein NVP1261O_33 [Vibrio phage 1.261.O._10N.286.51.A7]|uniref:Uncharacterized protein n=1 Tax=Vibrio phage 1.261.O._10N.286.51.A7 TaxID=1881237 RepID=A0A2I7RZG2_9CAUD|nr:hypothetical protein HOU80_gp69 [Vibrio phage 1.261.O._10N.286.51.A7]AUR99037.1 hypothetical protein NVP1261O_33 [Vibrio phage 1.261.O._10N.286.51.A7]
MAKRIIAVVNSPTLLSSSAFQRANTVEPATYSTSLFTYTRDRYRSERLGGAVGIGAKAKLHQLQEGTELQEDHQWLRFGRGADSNAQYRQYGVFVYDQNGDLLFGLGTDMWTGSSSLCLWTPLGVCVVSTSTQIFDFEFISKDNGDGTADYTVNVYNPDTTLFKTQTWAAQSTEHLTKKMSDFYLIGSEDGYGDDATIYLFVATSGIPTQGMYPVVLHPEAITSSTVESAPTLAQLQQYGSTPSDSFPMIWGNDGEEIYYTPADMNLNTDLTYLVRGIAFGAIGDSPDDTGIQFGFRNADESYSFELPQVHNISNDSYASANVDYIEVNPETGRPFNVAEINQMSFGLKFKKVT